MFFACIADFYYMSYSSFDFVIGFEAHINLNNLIDRGICSYISRIEFKSRSLILENIRECTLLHYIIYVMVIFNYNKIFVPAAEHLPMYIG